MSGVCSPYYGKQNNCSKKIKSYGHKWPWGVWKAVAHLVNKQLWDQFEAKQRKLLVIALSYPYKQMRNYLLAIPQRWLNHFTQ